MLMVSDDDTSLTTLKRLIFLRLRRTMLTSTQLSFSSVYTLMKYNPDQPRSQKGNKYKVKRVPYNVFARGVPERSDED